MPTDPQRAPRREEIPPAIPGYELLGPIGRGSSGTVYRARSLAVDREVAIKILHAQFSGESRVVRRLKREARTTARLAHPHIVSAVDMGEAGGRWWYAMEFVDGPSLSERLRAEGRIREREALRLFIPLCEALGHLWEHGVVHRDIKPANILIDKAGGARLADLGLAFAEDDPSITGTGGTLGTPHYISPEQAIDPRKADVRSDIWSFGATLFHALCGRPPFAGASAAEVLSGVLYARIPDPLELEPSLSSRVALVLRKCLTRDPERRYQNPHELLLDLERVRERRKPKVRKSALDPVARAPLVGRRLALVLGGGVALLGAATFAAIHLPRAPGVAPAAPGEVRGPYAPLEELAARRQRAEGSLAEWLAELDGLEARVPPGERARYEDLVRTLEAELRRSARGLQDELETELEQEIDAGDLEAAWHAFTGELEERFQRRTGFRIEGLAAAGINLVPWRDRLALELESATETALSELEAALLDWRSARLAEAEGSLAQQDWERALAALRPTEPSAVLAEAGFRARLPRDSQAGLFDELALEFRLRAERLQDDWQALDRELKAFVLTRRATLEQALRASRPRIAAAEMLRADFERELFRRDLSRERMPAGLSRAGLEELEASARALAELEEHLLEGDARADFDEVEELAADALRRRAYEHARELWSEARARLTSAARFAASAPRLELVRRIDVRIAEAQALEGLLARVAERVWELDGQAIELTWGAITYPHVRIQAGADPLHQGFRAEGIPGVLELARLPSQQIEVLAGFPAEKELAPEERLTLALFRFHDGRALEARRALFSGELPADEPGRAIGPDLADRIAGTLERAELRSEEREQEAKRLLESVLDPEFQGHSRRFALARIARLLDEFQDQNAVRLQRAELLRLRVKLEEEDRPSGDAEFARVFAPERLVPSALGRVTLHYDFSAGALGAWEPGDWSFDGLGLVLGSQAPIAGWDELSAERGLRLVLREPLVPDNVELTLRLEALQGEQPARLLWLTAIGFQVALSASELPGTEPGARFLIGTEQAGVFLRRALAGEGKRADSLLVPGGPPRELRFKAARRSGRCELWLDGVLLEQTSGLRAPGGDARSLVLRSWGSVRVLSASVEGGR